MIFNRSQQPILVAKENTFYSEGVTGLGIVPYQSKWFGYICGMSNGSETIGVCQWESYPDGSAPDSIHSNPVLLGGSPGDFDELHVCDPALAKVGNAVYMYYSGLGKGLDSIGLATSQNGIDFTKKGLVLTGRAPDILFKNGSFHIFYVLDNAKGGYDVFSAVSDDGIHFKKIEQPVIAAQDGWDGFTVTTPRLIDCGEYVYCFYCGGSDSKDIPSGVGVCRSKDLISWDRYSGKVLECGSAGSPDADAVWLPTAFVHDGHVHLLYEGGCLNSRGVYLSSICHAAAPLTELAALF